MDRVELNRLVKRGVLRPMSGDENLEGMTNLQSNMCGIGGFAQVKTANRGVGLEDHAL